MTPKNRTWTLLVAAIAAPSCMAPAPGGIVAARPTSPPPPIVAPPNLPPATAMSPGPVPSPIAALPSQTSPAPSTGPATGNYRRPDVRGRALTPNQLPRGFTAGSGRDYIVDAEGGLWLSTASGSNKVIHLAPDGSEAGRWPVPPIDGGGSWGEHLIVPGLGIFTAAVAAWGPPDRLGLRLPSASRLTFTSVAGAAPWTATVVGGAHALAWVPDRRLLWLMTNTTTLDRDDSAAEVMSAEGRPLGRYALDGAVLIGARPDGSAVVSDPNSVKVLAPDGEILVSSSCICSSDPWTPLPRVDGEGAAWWTTFDDVVHRLGPFDVHPVPVPSSASSRIPTPEEVPFASLTTSDGTVWRSDARVDAVFGGASGLAGRAPSGVERRIAFPYFETVQPIGRASDRRLWVQGSSRKTTYLGLIDPANPPTWPTPGPAEVPDFPPATPDLPGLWQEVPEDAPSGPFDGTCQPEGFVDAYRFTEADGGIRVSGHYPMETGTVPVTVDRGLVTFPPVPVMDVQAAVTLRFDAVSGHLVGRDDTGRPIRLAKSAGKHCRGW